MQKCLLLSYIPDSLPAKIITRKQKLYVEEYGCEQLMNNALSTRKKKEHSVTVNAENYFVCYFVLYKVHSLTRLNIPSEGGS